MTTEKEISKIFQKEEDKMMEYLKWYETLPGNHSGKIRINRPFAIENKKNIQESVDAYPTRLAYMLETDPLEYNDKYPNAVMYENYKMKAYSIIYINTRKEANWYDEDMGFQIGLELILKEYVDNHPELKDLIRY